MIGNRRAALAGVLLLGVAAAHAAQFAVQVESGTRAVPGGGTVAYDLFVPVRDAALPPPPWPAVVLTHGFARNRGYHRANALYLAARGIAVLTPDMQSLFGGRAAQLRNIDATVDHLRWLQARARSAGDALHGLLDARRMALAGHSAGGAVSFEAALGAQASGVPVAALMLLDAVPWTATLARGAELAPLPVTSLRSEPSSCNAGGNVLMLLDDLPVPVEDVLIGGATHCDPENPSDALCGVVCGAATPAATATYQRLLHLFMQDALRAPPVEAPATSYFGELGTLEGRGSIVRAAYGPPALLRLRVDGADPGDGPVRLARTARVSVDLYLNRDPGELGWQLGIGRAGAIAWLTPAGPSAQPSDLYRAAAAPMYDFTLLPAVPPPAEPWTLVLRVVDGTRVVAEDRLRLMR